VLLAGAQQAITTYIYLITAATNRELSTNTYNMRASYNIGREAEKGHHFLNTAVRRVERLVPDT